MSVEEPLTSRFLVVGSGIAGLQFDLAGRTLTVEGPKGRLEWEHRPEVSVTYDESAQTLTVARKNDEALSRALHGTTRAVMQNMMVGVTQGYERSLEISGVGFKAELKGKDINFTLGFSHPVIFKLPEGVTAEVDAKQTKLVVRSADKHLLGLTAAKIRALRPPEPYKGKGVKYAEEIVRRKEGKTGAA